MAEARPRKGKGKTNKRLGRSPDNGSGDDRDTNWTESEAQDSDVAQPNEPLDDAQNRAEIEESASETERNVTPASDGEGAASQLSAVKDAATAAKGKSGPPPFAVPAGDAKYVPSSVEVVVAEKDRSNGHSNGGNGGAHSSREKSSALPDLPDIPILPPTRKSSTLDSLFDDDLPADSGDDLGSAWDDDLRPDDELASLMGGADDFDVESLLAQHEAEARARAAAKASPEKEAPAKAVKPSTAQAPAAPSVPVVAEAAPLFQIDPPSRAESEVSADEAHPLLEVSPTAGAEAPMFTPPQAQEAALPILPQGLTAKEIAAEAAQAKRESQVVSNAGTEDLVLPEVVAKQPVVEDAKARPVKPPVLPSAVATSVAEAPQSVEPQQRVVEPVKATSRPPALPPTLPVGDATPKAEVIAEQLSPAAPEVVAAVEVPAQPIASVPPAPAAPPVEPVYKPNIFHQVPEDVDVESLLVTDDTEAPAEEGSKDSTPAKSAAASFFRDKTKAGRLATGTAVGDEADTIPQLPEAVVHGSARIEHSEGFTTEEVASSDTVEQQMLAHHANAPVQEVMEAPEPEVFLPPALPEPEPEPEPPAPVVAVATPPVSPPQVTAPVVPVAPVAAATPQLPQTVVQQQVTPARAPLTAPTVASAPAPVVPPVTAPAAPPVQSIVRQVVTPVKAPVATSSAAPVAPAVPVPTESPGVTPPSVPPPAPAVVAPVVEPARPVAAALLPSAVVPAAAHVTPPAQPRETVVAAPPLAAAASSVVPAAQPLEQESVAHVVSLVPPPPIEEDVAPALPPVPSEAPVAQAVVAREVPEAASAPAPVEYPAVQPQVEERQPVTVSDVPELPVFPEAVAPAESEAVASLPPVPEEPEIPVFESTPGPVAVELPPVPEFTPVVSPPEVPDAQQDAAVVAHSDALSPLPPAPVADSQAEEAPVAADPLPEFPPLLPEPAIESIAAEPEAFLPPPPVEESAAYAFGAPAGEGWAELPPPPADEPEDQQLPPVPEEFAAAVPPVPQEDVAFAPPPVPEFGEMPPPPPDFEELPPVPTDDAASGEPALPGFPDIPPPPSAEDDAAQVPAVPEFPPADIPGLPPLPAEMGVTPSDRRSSRPSLLGAEPTRITKLSRKPEHLLTRRRSKTLTGGTSFGRLPEDGGAEDQGGSVNAVEAGTSTDQGTETGQGRFTRRAGDGSGRMAPPRELAGARKPKAAVPAGPPRTLAQMALWVSAHMLLWCGLFVLLVAMWVSTVLYFRETRVEGVIIPPPDTAKITEIFIVNDFSGDIGDLRTRLREQRAPLIARMQEREERIANIRREMEAKDEQVKRWLSEIEAKEAELKDVLANVVAERNKISKGPGSELMALYEQRQNALRQEIEERAQALNLENFKGTKEYPSPDVWLNNYSIALYGTPAATATKEKEWVQKKLSEWRDFVKYYEERAQEFASQLRAVEGVVGPKKQEVTQVTEELRARISEAQQSIGPLKDEIARVEVDQTADRGVEATLDQNFLLELQGMPDLHKKRSIAVDNNRFSLRHLQKKETGRLREWEVGTYRAFVRINVGGEENWAIGEFPIQDYDTTRVIIPPAAFEPILKILKDGLD